MRQKPNNYGMRPRTMLYDTILTDMIPRGKFVFWALEGLIHLEKNNACLLFFFFLPLLIFVLQYHLEGSMLDISPRASVCVRPQFICLSSARRRNEERGTGG